MPTFETVIDDLRKNLKEIAKQIKGHKDDSQASETNGTEDMGNL